MKQSLPFRSMSILAALAFLMLASCSKKDSAPAGPVAAGHIGIVFKPTDISFSLVDSATIVLNRQGTQTPYFLRAVKKDQVLEFDTQGFKEGNWAAQISIYCHEDPHADKELGGRLYELHKVVKLPLGDTSLILNAPAKTADSWKPYVFVRDNVKGVSATIPMAASDPYFDIVVDNDKWDYFEVERTTFLFQNGGGNLQQVNGQWKCANGCYTHQKAIIDNTSFAAFTQQAAQKEWDNAFVEVLVKDTETGETAEFLTRYRRR